MCSKTVHFIFFPFFLTKKPFDFWTRCQTSMKIVHNNCSSCVSNKVSAVIMKTGRLIVILHFTI